MNKAFSVIKDKYDFGRGNVLSLWNTSKCSMKTEIRCIQLIQRVFGMKYDFNFWKVQAVCIIIPKDPSCWIIFKKHFKSYKHILVGCRMNPSSKSLFTEFQYYFTLQESRLFKSGKSKNKQLFNNSIYGLGLLIQILLSFHLEPILPVLETRSKLFTYIPLWLRTKTTWRKSYLVKRLIRGRKCF